MMNFVLGYATCGAVFFGSFLVVARLLCDQTYWQILDESIADDPAAQAIVALHPAAYWAIAACVPAACLVTWPLVLYKCLRGILKNS